MVEAVVGALQFEPNDQSATQKDFNQMNRQSSPTRFWQSLFHVGRASALRLIPIVACVYLAATSPAHAADPPPPDAQSDSKTNQETTQDDNVAESASLPKLLRSVEGISQYELDNGVQILLFPDESKEVVTVNMTVFVGSRHEGYGEAGMAHLLEHMLFKGTPTHPTVPKSLTERGARFNGTTWMDRTNYYETLPASEDNLEFAVNLEADRLVNSFIRGEDLASEMTVVRNEFERGENSPTRVLMQRMESAAYDWHNYGKSTIGNQSDIERVPVIKLREFYRKFYRPDNVMVIVAGKFDPDHALSTIQAAFGPLVVPNKPINETYTVEPPKDGERTVVLRRVGDVQAVGANYHIPAGSHPDYAAVKALTVVLGDEPSGRLYKAMVETKIASSVYAMAYGFREPGLLMALAEVPKDNSLEQARVKLIEVLEDSWDENPITEAEVERAKSQILKQRDMASADTDRIAVTLSDWAAQGDWRLYFLYRDQVEALTVEQVRAAAKKYLVRNNRTVGLFIPSEESERVSIPESPDLNVVLKDYRGREAVAAGESFDPDPNVIEKRVLRGDLVGGIKYALLPKKTRGDSVSLKMTIRFGTPTSLKDKMGAVELLGLLMARGTTKLTYQELQDEYTRLKADVSIYTLMGLLNVDVKTKQENLPKVIELIGDVIKTPLLDEHEFELIRQQAVTSLQQSKTEPNALAPRKVQQLLSPYPKDDIRYVMTIDEEIAMYEAATTEQVRNLHAEYLGNQAGELAVVGNFEPAEIIKSVKTQLEGWTTDQPYVRIDRPAHPDVPGQVVTINTPDKSNALLYSSEQYALSDLDPEYAALTLGNFVLGGGSLSSRLADRVRQQEGLSYGVRSGLSPRPKDDRVDLTLYAITNPDNKDKLMKVIREEVDRLIADGVTPQELEAAKQSYLQAARISRTGDASLASMLLMSMFTDRTMSAVAEQEQQVRDATIDQVNAAIKKYIDPDKLVTAIAGDFKE
ncbi:Protease 3 precursor [Allorhodopirellula heiligendammensis]|uniref:Protease 3 n=2 Tax=Allorhodopirellula heiligendammensis TaxID=2714739 RepID=A0A5C6BVY2_9BACT|nr:Protease 3 precursor [Allorhodopirellula heiligendammensis]